MKKRIFGVTAAVLFTAFWLRSHPSAFAENGALPWPPKMNESYPDIAFIKADGSPLRMKDLKGKYVVLHYRGMTCPACNAMAGRRELMWNDPRVVDVEVLLFNNAMKPATAADAREWAEKYRFQGDPNKIVVGAPAWTHGPELYQRTYKMVIGGQLLDKEGIVRASVVTPAGQTQPTHYWPKLKSMLDQWLAQGV